MSGSLDSIIGRRLTQVRFVMDYVQLGFDGPTLTVLTWPALITKDAQIVMSDPKYRDLLCTLIDHRVSKASALEDLEMTIEFDNGTRLMIPLLGEDRVAAEAVILDDGDRQASW